MDTLTYKTKSANKATATKSWLLVDAENETVGRLASKVAYLVRGKHKTAYTPHVDCGDNVVIINAEKVRFSGKKMDEKVYTRYTGYPGGQRFATPKMLLAKAPERLLEHAIGRMLPKTRLGDRLRRNVFIYAGVAHEQEAQNPQKIDLKKIKERP
ncbi:MAG: 50S ribosomal protein L13 [Bacteroidetes bacterium]|nr:50S ribosomal protein L13 [Bacteroidota bacterium]PHX81981.1 MAG: 50S ribosomal protein L13 [Flavobacteriales bacterium]